MTFFFPDTLFFTVESVSSFLIDTLSDSLIKKNERTFYLYIFLCFHAASCFESVEQLTRDGVEICCDQNDWTDVTWQLRGDLLPELKKLVQTVCFQVLHVSYSQSSLPLREQKRQEKLLQWLQGAQEAVTDKDISTWLLIP